MAIVNTYVHHALFYSIVRPKICTKVRETGTGLACFVGTRTGGGGFLIYYADLGVLLRGVPSIQYNRDVQWVVSFTRVSRIFSESEVSGL